jgi:hypothetical protein
MNRIFYFFICVIILSASSCSKQCVQCTAKDKFGAVYNTSNVVCDPNFERKKFITRYETDFSGYNVACVDVNGQ